MLFFLVISLTLILMGFEPAYFIIFMKNPFASFSSPTAGAPAPLPDGYTSATAKVNGVRIHYVTGGTGEPLVLLHGWPQTWYAWHGFGPQTS